MSGKNSHLPLPQGLSIRSAIWTVLPVAPLESWDNEGGFCSAEEAPVPRVDHKARRLTLRNRLPEDTAVGCRERADADLVRASAGAEGPGRWRYESSAASWLQRAEMLGRLEARRHAFPMPCLETAAFEADAAPASASVSPIATVGDGEADRTHLHAEKFANGGFGRSGSYEHHSRVLRQTLAILGAARIGIAND